MMSGFLKKNVFNSFLGKTKGHFNEEIKDFKFFLYQF